MSVPRYLFIILAITGSFLQTGCTVFTSSQPENRIDMRVNGFSPDNRLLSIDFCNGSACYSGLLTLESGEIRKIKPRDPDENWTSGTFSPNGKYLTYAVKRKSEQFRFSQLGFYELATNKFTVLTHTDLYNDFPSFSPDGKQLIYGKSSKERKSGKTRFADWDIYEFDIESYQERQLTHFEFFSIAGPSYLPDGKHFIFSASAPRYFAGKVGIKAFHAYAKQYQDNRIFILEPEATELKPAFSNGKLSDGPKISRDGQRIIYHAHSDEIDRAAGEKIGGFNYDLFMLEDGQHRRLTKLSKTLRDFTLSPDGTLIA